MDYPRNNTFTFLFSTYKRTAGIAFTAILLLAIPITALLLGQQQDIRQHASEGNRPTIVSIAPVTAAVGTQVTITGTNFMPTGNVINFDGVADTDSGNGVTSTDGTSISFTLPTDLVGGCVPQPDAVTPAVSCNAVTQVPLTSGAHTIVVINSNGSSNSIQFTAIAPVSQAGTTPTVAAASTTASPTPTGTLAAVDSKLFDLNEDGHVDELDLNILYSSFGVRDGD
ncbi:MAG TPA: hypothetical protein VG965_02580 [Patescibacteria group bacterium]|nr:hypothetical protein [Patescibacteria group bacterium]